MTRDWRELFRLREVRGAYLRAPVAMTLALTLLLLLSMPLYVIKIELLHYVAWNGAGELYVQHALLVPLTLIN